VKSSKRKSKTVKLVICKDCWSEMPKRKAYKSDRETVA
jgi:ribosomal protein S26